MVFVATWVDTIGIELQHGILTQVQPLTKSIHDSNIQKGPTWAF